MGMFDEIRWDATLPEGHSPDDCRVAQFNVLYVALSAQSRTRLFVPQRANGIDPTRAHRRHPYCNQRNAGQY
jgi:hypothetical protein